MNNRLNNIGLCSRARGIILGEELVVEAIRKKTVYLVFLASDASHNTKKRITDKAKFYDVEVDTSFTSDELSHSIGMTNRKVIGISNKGFAKILKK